MTQKKVAVTTLGCKVNQYESAALEELFRRRGYQIVEFEQIADVYVINTCTVTHLGDRKSRQMIRRANKTNPDAVVVATGCYAQTAPDEVLEVEGVDLVLGAGNRAAIVDLVESAVKGNKVKAVGDILKCREFEDLPGEDCQGRVRAYLKIQEGCENFCSYCIVPYARGPLRSRKPESVLAAANNLVRRGFREIVLTGIHTGAYGRDKQDKHGLVRLLEKLASVPGIARIRLSSIEPNDITPELIELVAAGTPFCRHLHIPLQSGDDTVLAKMRRRYNTAFYRNLVEEARNKVAGLGVTTDVMVGFPGETEENFDNTYSFIKEMNFSGLHVFKYSPRRGTPAADFPAQVNPADKEKRSRALITLGENLACSFAAGHLGQTVEVLVEQALPEERENLWEGHTDNYIRVVFPGARKLQGTIINVNAEKLSGTSIMGRIILK
ncbi:threonylcarbamoyladenosine tRNA methylthiotransferase MtaB [Desulfotomaculum arcticum]|uniref:Threonylcarbamoyladenosine tRNA methylthiotransferase MtaB n=1 Tax=Desulfotruncus arcticus DSM 17038 TaxID=1121424 RepID=A0A1I2XGV9_9FIRM|nr:tRNA (N(6)-L-threonylcarbamoyladenosine(37)-C(2))-methylthiotransferase MtaB [Desulfotruncus arcticus]SFH12764.1 threonylcarbamoyladenosine tRNA methylthiotransferase MtaB [Desulfotomaculum arcticum] [Desulfotruncus arcticus DSM 17038]